MNSSATRNPYFRNKLLFVAATFIVLMLLSAGAARLRAQWHIAHDSQSSTADAAAAETQSGEFSQLAHEYFARHALAVALALVIPMFCFYVLRPPHTISSYWLLFSTAAYLAFATHCFWSMLRSPPESSLLSRSWAFPRLGLALLGWWGIDLILAWGGMAVAGFRDSRFIRLQRGALQLALFLAALYVAFGPTTRSVLFVGLGVVLLLAVVASWLLCVVTRRVEPDSLLARVFDGSFAAINRLGIAWYRLPTFLAALNLEALRNALREHNLHGTEDIPVTNHSGREAPPPAATDEDLVQRNYSGYHNDLRPGKAEMGSASSNTENAAAPGDFNVSNPGARFGRNVPRTATYPDIARLLEPSPREISRHLLARDKLIEAPILNFLAAAWIQFETHDWFFHGNPPLGNEIPLPLADDDPWAATNGPMRIRRTRPDPTRDYAVEQHNGHSPPPTYVSASTHWWDASQIYGDDHATTQRLRSNPKDSKPEPHGKLYVDPKNSLLPMDPVDPDGPVELTGFNGNWWLGLTLLHTLFVREHNVICDHLHEEYPTWGDDRIFSTARLVNAALMAKIHTVEWTTAILPNPSLQIGMNANWWGLAGEPIKKTFGRISGSDAVSGILGSAFNHHAADYALTEEFVSVYRMHPLMRDDLTVYSVATGQQLDHFDIKDVRDKMARERGLKNASLADVLYSFGICHPGALTLRNFPNFLRDIERTTTDREKIDLAAIDILRDRERGVPRYNKFREYLRMPRFRSIDQLVSKSEQLSNNPGLAQELKRIYKNQVENVDLLVGMFAETPPPDFGFSDTAFRIFILMASRRLKSDRFFTTDFTPQVYSPAGFAWVNDNNMRSVLLRHFPELAPALRGVDNAFAPWRTIAQSRTFDPYEPELDYRGKPL